MSDESRPGTAEGRELSRVEPPRPPSTVSPPSQASPPPRPPMTRSAPPPIVPITGPSALQRTARALWGLSLLAGAVALVVAFLRRTDQFGRLQTHIVDLQPGYDAETVDTAATILFWGTGALLVVFLATELLLRGATERSAAARWWMLIVVALHAAAAAATISFVALGAEGMSTRLLILTQLVLAGAALLVGTIAAVSRRRPPEPTPARARRRR